MAPTDQPGPPIEDLLALNEQVGPSSQCACGATVIRVGTGVWRRDTHPMGADRIVCAASDDRRHHPAVDPKEPPDTDPVARLRPVRPPWIGSEPQLRTGDLP